MPHSIPCNVEVDGDGRITQIDGKPLRERPRPNGNGHAVLPKESQHRRKLEGEASEAKATIDYEEAVAEAKQIVTDMKMASEGRKMRLGELADKVEKVYGEQRLKRFATDIGIALCTLGRCRSVYRAWQTTKEAPAPKFYSVAQELQAHPDRFELIKNNPYMTKSEARKIMRTLKANDPNHQREEMARWFRAVIQRASDMIRDAGIADGKVSPELQHALRGVIDPTLLPTLKESGEASIRFATFLEQFAHLEESPERQSAQAAE
jgi:hypothetical protein